MYGEPPGYRVKGRVSTTDASNHELLPACGKGFKNWISQITVSNSSNTATEVHIKSGTTIIYTIPAPATGGAILSFPDPIDSDEDTAINIAAASGVTTITVSAAGHKGRAQ